MESEEWKRCDSSDSDSVKLMTPPTTPIFDFHLVISSLMTPTLSLVKTSLKQTHAVNCAAVYYVFVNIERQLLC